MDAHQPTVRVSGPADLVAAVPHLLGFMPEDSLVLVGIGRHGRVGLTARVDLPADDELPPTLLDRLVNALHRAGAQSAVLLLYRQDPHVGDHLRLTAPLERRLRTRGVALRDELVVWSGRFRSLRCQERSCCPPEGRPVPDPTSSPLAAGGVLTGRAVLPDRAAVLASIDPVAPGELRAVSAAAAAMQRQQEECLGTGVSPARRSEQELAEWREVLGQAAEGTWSCQAEQVAALLVGLADVPTRDAMLLAAAEHEPGVVVSVLVEVVRRAGPQWLAPAAAALAWHAYLAGDGCLAGAALDRAETAEPTYSLALLLRTCLDAAVPPTMLTEVLEAVAVADQPAGGGAGPPRS